MDLDEGLGESGTITIGQKASSQEASMINDPNSLIFKSVEAVPILELMGGHL